MASPSSNEEIIENLTKDLRKTCVRNDDGNVNIREIPTNSSTHNQSRSTSGLTDNDAYQEEDLENGTPETNNANKEDVNEVENIDENSLQDRDALLSDEDKENFLKETLKYKADGNDQFKNGEYFESVITYSKGLQICPLIYTSDRSILYANRAASKHKLERKESAVQDCSKAVELNSNYLKAFLRRAKLYEELDKLDEALEDYKKVLELDPRNREALSAAATLPERINERNEKLKTEMLDKLKDLGNMVLRPFGLSTNNFKMTKDENSGGYSINFVQNS